MGRGVYGLSVCVCGCDAWGNIIMRKSTISAEITSTPLLPVCDTKLVEVLILLQWVRC